MPGQIDILPPTFPVTAPGKAAVAAGFIFVAQDGVLVYSPPGPAGASAKQAFVERDNSATAAYKGLALFTTPVVELYAANFQTGRTDVFDAQFNTVTLASGGTHLPCQLLDRDQAAGFGELTEERSRWPSTPK